VVCITLIAYCLLLWLQTIKEIFFIDHISIAVKIVWIAVVVLDIAMELHTCKIADDTEILNLRKIREIYFHGQAKFDVVNLIVVVAMFFFETGELFSICCTVVSIYTLYEKISEKYHTFKTYSTDVAMLHEFKSMQIFVFMLFMGHLFVQNRLN
jgi:hypothetical protein